MTNDGIQKIIEYLQRLEQRVENGFARVDGQFERVDEQFKSVEARFDQTDQSIEHLYNAVIELHDDHEKRIVRLEENSEIEQPTKN